MSKLCEQAMKVWIQIVDENIRDLDRVKERSLNYDGKYHPRFDTECVGAYWALRGMITDERSYVETYERMDQYFNAKCISIFEAFYSITDDEE